MRSVWLGILLSSALCTVTGVPVKHVATAARRPRLDGRIVGGSDVDISQYPWQLYLTVGSDYCGASIISREWALSAAHCVDGASLVSMRLRAGTSTRGSGGSVHSVSGGSVHGSYSYYEYDIAVIQVTPAFSLGADVRPVGLAASEPPAGSPVAVSGWGRLSEGGTAPSQLQAVTVQVVDRAVCNAAYGNVTPRMICAGTEAGGRGVCYGDSGGPLVANSTQVGIVSWGNGCGDRGYPDVYTNVASLRSWIQSAAGV